MLRRRAAGAVQAGLWTSLPGRASPVLVSTLQLTAMQPGSLCKRSRKAPGGWPCSICSAVPRSTPKPQTQEGLQLFHIGANCRAKSEPRWGRTLLLCETLTPPRPPRCRALALQEASPPRAAVHCPALPAQLSGAMTPQLHAACSLQPALPAHSLKGQADHPSMQERYSTSPCAPPYLLQGPHALSEPLPERRPCPCAVHHHSRLLVDLQPRPQLQRAHVLLSQGPPEAGTAVAARNPLAHVGLIHQGGLLLLMLLPPCSATQAVVNSIHVIEQPWRDALPAAASLPHDRHMCSCRRVGGRLLPEAARASVQDNARDRACQPAACQPAGPPGGGRGTCPAPCITPCPWPPSCSASPAMSAGCRSSAAASCCCRLAAWGITGRLGRPSILPAWMCPCTTHSKTCWPGTQCIKGYTEGAVEQCRCCGLLPQHFWCKYMARALLLMLAAPTDRYAASKPALGARLPGPTGAVCCPPAQRLAAWEQSPGPG